MGTLIEITVSTNGPRIDAMNAIDEALSKFDYVINKFSRFDSNSELSKLNRNSGNWFKLTEDLFTLIEYSLFVSKETNALFDPTVIDLLRAYGYDVSYDKARIANQLSKSLPDQIKQQLSDRPSPLDIKLNKETNEVKLIKGQNLDLGASAKGFAIDLAKNKLLELGFADFLINAGGDIWAQNFKTVTLFSPHSETHTLGNLELKNEAVAASGSFARRVGMFHHLLNPKTKSPHNKTLQTYAIAESAMIADAWATALFMMGPEGIDLAHQNDIKTIIITDNGIYGDTNLIS